MRKISKALVAGALAGITSGVFAEPLPTPKDAIADSIIVRMKDLNAHKRGLSAIRDRLGLNNSKAILGKTLQVREQLNRSFWVVDIDGNPTDREVLELIEELKKGDYGVLSAEPNHYVYALDAVYNDPAWDSIQKPRLNQSKQSGYDNGISQFLSTQKAAGAGKTIAIIDTGKIDHPEVTPTISNEVNFSPRAINSNKADSTAGLGQNCDFQNDTAIHHGLKMSSLAAGIRDNALGLVGFSKANTYSVRSLYTCDGAGTTSETIKGILWSAGLDMDQGQNFVANGFPRNNTPATVINLSLGSIVAPGQNACPTTGAVHAAIQRAIAAGSIIVAAAGNEYDSFFLNGSPAGRQLSLYASCSGVVSVGALDFNGGHANYSNVPASSEQLVTSVPVGNGFSVDSSTYQAEVNNGYSFGVGTSQATAIMSGLLASLLDVIGDKRPSNQDLIKAISNTGSPFSESDSACAPSIRNCGTRLQMLELTKALDENVDLQTLFRGSIAASSLNLTDVAEIVSFEDDQGRTDDLTATIANDGQFIEFKTNRSGRFILKAGSTKYANRADRTELSTSEVVINQFGDVGVTLSDIKRTEVKAKEVLNEATRVLSISNFNPANPNSPTVSQAFEIFDGNIIWNFNGSVSGTYEFSMTYEIDATTLAATTTTAKTTNIQMTVRDGKPTAYTQRINPTESTPEVEATVVNNSGGGGSLSALGLLLLTLLIVINKQLEQINNLWNRNSGYKQLLIRCKS